MEKRTWCTRMTLWSMEILSNYSEHKKGYMYPYEAVVVRM